MRGPKYMKVEQVVCDECRRIKGESNHWKRIGVLQIKNPEGGVAGTFPQLTLGVVPNKPMPGFEIRDICGEQCFHKHIDRLLGTLVEPGPPPLPATDSQPQLGYT